MTEEEFLERMADILNLEAEQLSMEFRLADEPAFDSVAVLSIIILLDECGKVVQGPTVRDCATLADVWALASQ